MKSVGKEGKTQLTWDEQNMKESEKGRGQFEKIEQPKTPFCLSPSNSQEKLEAYDKSSEQRQVQENLKKAKTNSTLNSHYHHSASDLNQQFLLKMGKNCLDELITEETPKIKNSFIAKRAEHYKNEYKTVQQMGKWNTSQ